MNEYDTILDNLAGFKRYLARVCQENQAWEFRVVVREPWFLAVARLCQFGFKQITTSQHNRANAKLIYNISSEYAMILLKVVMTEWAVDYLKSDRLVFGYLNYLPFQEFNAHDSARSIELTQAIIAHAILIAALDKFHPELWSVYRADCEIKSNYELVQKALSGKSLPQQKRWTLPPFSLPVMLLKNEKVISGDAKWTVGAWILAIEQSEGRKPKIREDLETKLKVPLSEDNTWLIRFGWRMKEEEIPGQWLKSLDSERYSMVFRLQEDGSEKEHDQSKVEKEIIQWFAEKLPHVDANKMIENGWDNWASFLSLTEESLVHKVPLFPNTDR